VLLEVGRIPGVDCNYWLQLQDAEADLLLLVEGEARELDGAVGVAMVEELEEVGRRLSHARHLAAEQLELPLETRDGEFPRQWMETFNGAVERLAEARHLLRPAMETTSRVVMLESIQQLAWTIREYAGRERTRLAVAIGTGGPLERSDALELLRYHQKVSANWRRLAAWETVDSLSLPLRYGIGTLRAGLFGRWAQLRLEILLAGFAGLAYPLDLEDYFRESSRHLAEVEELSHSVTRELYGLLAQAPVIPDDAL
jgi:hypothetical protein